MANVDLLYRTIAHIETHPYDHDQQWWRCGTARCFAGWASFFAGGRFVSSEDDKNHIVASNGVRNFRASTVRTPDGQLLHVADHAAMMLGIDDRDADALFSPDNTVTVLRRMVNNLLEYGSTDGDPTPVEQWRAVAHQ
ncbi:hypothetical protein CH276_22535 [Rhodococcus sp. 06-470-2]|uniref:hypothetical protein n=1 Tax=unclassified Rhodococcus (in: high G+C Gram-positive bacteria) TaxID=192944 RepID=UPI000B9AD3D6|nr:MULTISPECIES: hypothetical protein [unclassified Rhodococcus (in: high G+C Gram-positive bacteria)]OZC59228.1 hypothetical protein CH276_22535 [Rhodococcus sp. 06-470-2]OZE66815.1 hypothetical protein CH265_07860 [Rhodococcus sp. 05-2221-1B]